MVKHDFVTFNIFEPRTFTWIVLNSKFINVPLTIHVNLLDHVNLLNITVNNIGRWCICWWLVYFLDRKQILLHTQTIPINIYQTTPPDQPLKRSHRHLSGRPVTKVVISWKSWYNLHDRSDNKLRLHWLSLDFAETDIKYTLCKSDRRSIYERAPIDDQLNGRCYSMSCKNFEK